MSQEALPSFATLSKMGPDFSKKVVLKLKIQKKFFWQKKGAPWGSLSNRLCFEYFSQFKIDSETYTAVSKEKLITKQGEILRHIEEEFIITFVEMFRIYKRHTN